MADRANHEVVSKENVVDKCKAAFPLMDIPPNETNHIINAADLKDAQQNGNHAAQTWLAHHYGFPHADDIFNRDLDLAGVASKCTKEWQAADKKLSDSDETKDIIAHAKENVEQAILNGEKYAKLFYVGEGDSYSINRSPTPKDPWASVDIIGTGYTQPKLTQQAKDILAGVNAIPGLHAEVKTFSYTGPLAIAAPGRFYIVASKDSNSWLRDRLSHTARPTNF